jgi:hypothetical protein
LLIRVPTTGPCQGTGAEARLGDHVDQGIAVDDLTGRVDHHEPVAVAVEGDPDVGALIV